MDAVFSSPQHPYTKRLLDSLPVIGGRARDRAADPRLAARPRRSARRLPLPSALPVPRRALRRRPAAARGRTGALLSACHYAPWAQLAGGRGPGRDRRGGGSVSEVQAGEIGGRDADARPRRRGRVRGPAGDGSGPSTASRSSGARARSSGSSANRGAGSRRSRGRCSVSSRPPTARSSLSGGAVSEQGRAAQPAQAGSR